MTVATTEKKSTSVFGSVGITAEEVEGLVTGTFPGIPDEYTDAEILDHQVRKAFAISLHAQDYLTAVVTEAKEANVHKTLIDPETGKAYRSWTDYIGKVLAAQEIDVKGMGARQRGLLIAMLYNTGLSQGSVAKALGIGIATVNRSIQSAREAGEVAKDRKTVASDGREFAGTEEGAATSKPKAEKTPLEKAEAHVKSLTALLPQMDAGQVADFRKLLTTLTREAGKAAKATA